MSIDVSVWVWKHGDASGSALLVLLALADISNHEGVCWPSVPTIATRTRLHEQTVRGHLQDLRDRGAIEVEPQPGRPNRYRILMPTPTDMTTPSGFRRGTNTAQSTPTKGIPLPGTEPLKTNSKEPSIEPLTDIAVEEQGDRFDEFWSVYPRKVGKPSARRAFKAALKVAPAEVIIAGARRYRDDPSRDPLFTKYPQGWLSDQRWTVPYAAPQVSEPRLEAVPSWVGVLGIPPEEYVERRSEPGWVESMARRAERAS